GSGNVQPSAQETLNSLRETVESTARLIPGASKPLAAAAQRVAELNETLGGLKQLAAQASQANELLTRFQQGEITPADALDQLAKSPQAQQALKALGERFPEAAKLVGGAGQTLQQVQQGVQQAQNIAA